MGRLVRTPSQTVGPYFSMLLGGQNSLLTSDVAGERIRIEGQVVDGDGKTIEDALIEIWQANAAGHYRHPADNQAGNQTDDQTGNQIGKSSGNRAFTGFGRAETDFSTGLFWFDTVRPGRVPDPEGEMQAPHISVVIQARGMLKPTFTRIYFSDEDEANHADLILGMVPAARRKTLIARLVPGTDPKVFRFDIRFQGDDETVFFDL